MEPDELPSSRSRNKAAYLLLLAMLYVTWLLFSQAFAYAWVSEGRIETGTIAKPLVLPSCYSIRYEAGDKAFDWLNACWFNLDRHAAGEAVKLRVHDGTAIIDDPMVAIRSGIAASLWLMFSLLIFFKLPRR